MKKDFHYLTNYKPNKIYYGNLNEDFHNSDEFPSDIFLKEEIPNTGTTTQTNMSNTGTTTGTTQTSVNTDVMDSMYSKLDAFLAKVDKKIVDLEKSMERIKEPTEAEKLMKSAHSSNPYRVSVKQYWEDKMKDIENLEQEKQEIDNIISMEDIENSYDPEQVKIDLGLDRAFPYINRF